MLLRCLLLFIVCNVQAKPQVTWLQTDWPPHQIVAGAFQGQGTFDLLLQRLMITMPQFEHRTQLVSLARLNQAFVHGGAGFCALGALYSEHRAEHRLYSAPMAVGPALSAGYLKATLTDHPAMSADGVDLAALALDSTLVGAYQPNRFYPPAVEQMLQHANTNLSSHNFSNSVNAAGLLANRRVNYIIEYPERMQYYNLLLPQAVALEHRPILGANIASVSHVTCTMDDTGQAVIAAVNRALPSLWQQTEYIQAMQRWLDDSAQQRLSADIQRLQQQASMQLESGPDNAIDTRH